MTLARSAEVETRVRGSTFLAHAAPAASEEQARAALAGRERLHFDATHNCSAWRLRSGVWRANDAGEPGGSAGAPILAAIDGAGLLDCVVIVTRYFGGTKLGVGGLIRAYGEAAALALQTAPRLQGVPATRLRLQHAYEDTAPAMRALETFAAAEIEYAYAEGGHGAMLEFTIPTASLASLQEFLREQTAGRLAAEAQGERTLFSKAV